MATIFCFTATGNSLYVAKRLAKKIDGEVRSMHRDPARCGDGVIGFVFPVYFWGLPRMVVRFVSALKIENRDAYVFAAATSGGNVPGVTGRIRQLLKPKGVRLQYGMGIQAVSNYLPEYLPKDRPERRQAVDRQISVLADAVQRRQSNRIQPYTAVPV